MKKIITSTLLLLTLFCLTACEHKSSVTITPQQKKSVIDSEKYSSESIDNSIIPSEAPVHSSDVTNNNSEPNEIPMHTVRFYDAYGKVIRTEKVLKGEDAVGIVGQTPIKESDDTYHYRFIGWDTKYTNVQKDLHVKPKYDRTPIIDEVVDPNDVPTTTPEDNTTESTPSTNPTVPSVPSTTPEPSTPSGSSTDEASPT